MAKTIQKIKLVLTNNTTSFENSNSSVMYSVVDGDLSKHSSFVTSGINVEQNVEDYWDDVIDEINSREGIV